MKAYLEKIIKNNKILQKLYIVFGSFFFKIISLFVKVDKKTILFSAMSGNSYEYTSPYLLYVKIKQLYGDSYRYVWAFSKKMYNSVNCKEHKIKIDSFKYFYYVLKTGVWVTDVNIERGLKLKRKNQYYVNTWHGGVTKGFPSKRKDYNLANVDIFCSDGLLYDEFFQKNYNVNKKAILHCGRPREDDIFNLEKQRISLRNKFGFNESDIVLLYMPTWRESNQQHYFNFEKVLSSFPNLKIVFHGHNLDDYKKDEIKSILNLSDEKNNNILYAISDLLVSDYSSCMYDFLLLQKPVLIYAEDYDEYKNNRGLAVDFERIFPLSISKTTEDLVSKIQIVIKENHNNDFNEFLSKVVSINRKQSATNAIIKKMIEDNILLS